jgi:hypothetical protein
MQERPMTRIGVCLCTECMRRASLRRVDGAYVRRSSLGKSAVAALLEASGPAETCLTLPLASLGQFNHACAERLGSWSASVSIAAALVPGHSTSSNRLAADSGIGSMTPASSSLRTSL